MWLFQAILKTSAAGEEGKYFLLFIFIILYVLLPLKDATGVSLSSKKDSVCLDATCWDLHIRAQRKCFFSALLWWRLRAVCRRHGGSRQRGDWRINAETCEEKNLLCMHMLQGSFIIDLHYRYAVQISCRSQSFYIKVWPLRCHEWPLLPQTASRRRLLSVCLDPLKFYLYFNVFFCFISHEKFGLSCLSFQGSHYCIICKSAQLFQ